MKRVRLTESQLQRVIAESVRRVLAEGDSPARKERLVQQAVENGELSVAAKDGECTVYEAISWNGLRVIGRGTKWSPVADERYFQHYAPLYVCVCQSGERFLFSPNEGVVVNENDEEVSSYPSVIDSIIGNNGGRQNESFRRRGRRMW